MTISVQEASVQLHKQIDDLQTQVSELRAVLDPTETDTIATGEVTAQRRMTGCLREIEHVLWVDDNPENNAYETASLRDRGIAVTQARTTQEGLAAFERQQFDAVVTDMGRHERDGFKASAGLELTRAIRAVDVEIPIYVYSLPEKILRLKAEMIEAGVTAATSSAVAMLEFLTGSGAEFARRLEHEVERVLRLAGAEFVTPPGGSGAPDFVVDYQGQRIAVEIKSWHRWPGNARLVAAAGPLKLARQEYGAQELILVAPELTVSQVGALDALADIQILDLASFRTRFPAAQPTSD